MGNNFCLTTRIFLIWRCQFCGVKDCHFDIILLLFTKRSSQCCAKRKPALLIPERDCLTLASIALFEMIVGKAAFITTLVVNL